MCICDEGYDGDDCGTVTDADNIILFIIDDFEGIYADYKLWIQVTGAIIKSTCSFEPHSKF